jgi:hypothetical protein
MCDLSVKKLSILALPEPDRLDAASHLIGLEQVLYMCLDGSPRNAETPPDLLTAEPFPDQFKDFRLTWGRV